MRALFLISFLALLCAGCATQGAPQPPSLHIPQAVADLKAERKGDRVNLTWSVPQQTTDGVSVRGPGKVMVRRATSENSVSAVLSEVPFQSPNKSDAAQSQHFEDSLSAFLGSTPADFAIYTVEARNDSGKGAGPSNPVNIALVPAVPAPENVRAEATAQGVSISWKQLWQPQNRTHLVPRYVYRIMRRAEGAGPATMLAQLDLTNEAMLFLDTSIEWEKPYQYWITPITLWENPGAEGTGLAKGEVPGEDSQIVPVFTKDIYPPVAPADVQAVFSGDANSAFIDLVWSPNTEPDLAGYNVYRWTSTDPQPKKLNTGLVKAPAFRDTAVQPAIKYFYAITAVDLRSNESAKSAEASEMAPRQ